MIRLTERERQVLLMRNEGHTFDEIAKAIGVATGTARTIWDRARIKLKYLKTELGHMIAMAEQDYPKRANGLSLIRKLYIYGITTPEELEKADWSYIFCIHGIGEQMIAFLSTIKKEPLPTDRTPKCRRCGMPTYRARQYCCNCGYDIWQIDSRVELTRKMINWEDE